MDSPNWNDFIPTPEWSHSPWSNDTDAVAIERFQETELPSRHLDNSTSTGSANRELKQLGKGRNFRRREHKKSRAGCFNCKSRKIKCQETRPACDNCTSKHLTCEYPSPAQQRVKRRPANDRASTPLSLVSLQSTPTLFTLKDMRLFHHFIVVAYPHLPLGNERVWVKEIPVIAHQHEYLMHAMLSLAASHLTAVEVMDCATDALTYRHLAVKGLNKAMARMDQCTKNDYDAMLAACYALTFECSYAGAGIVDFMTMVRGCALVTERISEDNWQSSFWLDGHAHLQFITPRMKFLPVIQSSLVDGAVPSFETVKPLLDNPTCLKFYGLLLNVLLPLTAGDSQMAYLAFTQVFTVFYETSTLEFQEFTAPKNHTAMILLVHFIALQMLAVPLTRREWDERAFDDARLLLGPMAWGENIFAKLPLSKHRYVEWPRTVFRDARSTIRGIQSEYDNILKLAKPMTPIQCDPLYTS